MPARPPSQRPSETPASLYEALLAHFGDLQWWPGDGPYAVMVGAVLTQRTAWRNVEIALDNLVRAGITDMPTLLATSREELETLIRPSGTYRQKAARLHDLFKTVNEKGGGSVTSFLDRPTEVLREDLLAVKGIGPETADSIILYAAGRPVFVVDAYTMRILERMAITSGGSYDDIANWFTSGLPPDPALFNNYHAALVELAKIHCRTVPLCRECPIRSICPTGRTESITIARRIGDVLLPGIRATPIFIYIGAAILP